MSLLGDFSSWAMPRAIDLLTFLPWVPWGIPPCVWLWLLVNARGRDGTQAPQSWVDTCYSEKTKASPLLSSRHFDVVSLPDRLTWHFLHRRRGVPSRTLTMWYSLSEKSDTSGRTLISWHVAQSHGAHLASFGASIVTLESLKSRTLTHCFYFFASSSYCSSSLQRTLPAFFPCRLFPSILPLNPSSLIFSSFIDSTCQNGCQPSFLQS